MLLVPTTGLAQQASASARPIPATELDTWKGSSLGIRLELKDEFPVVTNIYSHVVDSSPFRENDQIHEIGDVKFPGATLEQVGELLDRTDPETEILAIVKRDDTTLRLNVATFRKEYVDIQAIFRSLNRNRIIEKHLKETEREGLLDNMADRMAQFVRASQSPRQAAESINRIIDEIGVSHTAIIPASAGLAFSSRNKGSIGLVLQRHNINSRDGYFVVDMKPGSPSYGSELRLGDEVLSINNVPIAQSRRLDLSGHEDRYQLFAIHSDIDENIKLEFLRSPFDDVETITLATAKDPGTVASLRASKRIIEAGSERVGYLRFWNLMSMGVSTQFSKILDKDFSSCDAIIMDLRGRGGIVPAVTSLNRIVAKVDRPVVVIIDRLTRSAKEMLTYLLKKHEHVLVVGMKTSGAVTGATIARLPSGNSLMIPVASADSLKQFVDGAIIEGVGVEPDEEVNYFVPYSAGEDRILNVAVRRASELAKTTKSDASSQEPTPQR